MKLNLLNYDRTGLETFFKDLGEKPFRARQVLKWLHQHGATTFTEMTNLSNALREKLEHLAVLSEPEVLSEKISRDGTIKWLLRVDSGNCIETVFIPERSRGTLCISSQIGCIVDCAFCATGQQGFNRNLSTAEIISQVRLAARHLQNQGDSSRRITNVVFMGMGEPLFNYENVLRALRLLLDDDAWGLSKRRVTVSTSGVIPYIDRLGAACDVSLAISLHACRNALRDHLVPLNRKYPIKPLLEACRRYVADAPRRKVTFEYVMLDQINDQPRDALDLVSILEGIPSKINLIPFNPFPGTDYATSPQEAIDRFSDITQKAGLITVTRKTRGDTIDAACGQLAGKISDRTRRQARHAQEQTLT